MAIYVHSHICIDTSATVRRILHSENLYMVLNLTIFASVKDVEESFTFLVNELSRGSWNSESHKALHVLEKAYETLKDRKSRNSYNSVLNNLAVDGIITPAQLMRQRPPPIRKKPVARDLHPLQQLIYDKASEVLRKIYEKVSEEVPGIILLWLPCILIGGFLVYVWILLFQHAFHEDPCDDYYGILGVTRKANTSLIKKSYRQLARQLHPDKMALAKEINDTTQFRLLVDAYKVLSNNTRRKEYDLECKDGIRIKQPKNESRYNATKEGVRKYGLYSVCWVSKSCLHMYYYWERYPPPRL